MNVIYQTIQYIQDKLDKTRELGDIALIRGTGLFPDRDDEFIQSSSKVLKRYKKGKTINTSDERLCVIKKGTVGMFQVINGQKIQTATLTEGQFFGADQFLSQRGFKARQGVSEALDDTVILELSVLEPTILDSHPKNVYHHTTTQSVGFYKPIEKMIADVPSSKVRHFSKGDLIYDFGQESLFAYVILSGEVMLLMPDPITKQFSRLILHEGSLFGEIGVLENRTRYITAMAKDAVTVLEIDKQYFIEFYNENVELQQFYQSLRQLYKVPLRGTIQQYICHIEGVGTTITNHYVLDNGDQVTSNAIVDQAVFDMTINHSASGEEYYFENEGGQLTLQVVDDCIVKITAFGVWNELPELCTALLNKDKFSSVSMQNSTTPDEIPIESDLICPCMALSRAKLQVLIDSGLNSIESIAKATGATTLCNHCQIAILDMLGMRYWQPCELIKNKSSFTLNLNEGSFLDFQPGQSIIVQACIDDVWKEKSYYIWHKPTKNALEILVPFDDNDDFFAGLKNGDIVEVSQPQGKFIINSDPEIPVFCYAENTGIYPFAALTKRLSAADIPKRIHINFYGTLQHIEDFRVNVFPEKEDSSTITINFKEGRPADDEFLRLLSYFENAEVYICGSKSFVKTISDGLTSINYDPNKIFKEEIQ